MAEHEWALASGHFQLDPWPCPNTRPMADMDKFHAKNNGNQEVGKNKTKMLHPKKSPATQSKQTNRIGQLFISHKAGG